MFKSIGAFAVKFRFWIIAVWVIAAVAMALLAPSLSQVGSMKESDFLPPNSDSQLANNLMEKYFPDLKSASTVSLIFYNPQKISESDLAYAKQIRDWLESGQTSFKVDSVTSVFDNPELAANLYSPDKTTMLINAGLSQAAFESKSIATTQEIRDNIKNVPQGLKVYVSGEIGVYGDMFAALNKSINITTLVTIILVIVLLIIIYRSPIAALVPLATIGIAFLIARGIIGYIAQAGVSIWSQLDVFLVVLIFGIGTDYCLFLISRFREELGRNDSRVAAMRTTVGRIGAVITASALAVIVGLAGMYAARYNMIKTMGPMMGLAIFITLLAALTLAPALASVFGRILFWPRHEEARVNTAPKQSKFWSRVASLATGRPVIVAGIIIILMLLPYFAMPDLHRSFDQMAEIPPNAESIQGYKVLQTHYTIGEIDPIVAVVAAPQGKNISDPDALAALTKAEKALQAVPGVVSVQSIVLPEGTGQTPTALKVSGQLGAMASGISDSLSSSSANASALVDPAFAQSFSGISTYLNEISGNFTWVKNETSYQAIPADLKNINDAIAAIKSGALVENQLNNLSVQVMSAAQALSTPGATLTSNQIGLMVVVKGYLDELAAQYPQIKTQAGYQTAYPIITKIGVALVSSQPVSMLPPDVQAVMAALPDNLQQLASALMKINDSFIGKNAYLFSQALARASTGPSPADTLKSQLTLLIADLQNLGTKFQQNGDPIFLSPSMIASSPQLKTLVNSFISPNGQATRLYVITNTYPQSEDALTIATAAREALKTSLSGTALQQGQAHMGGTSAVLADVRQVMDRDFNVIMVVVICAIFVVLAVLLRSLIAPVYLLITVLLSYGATLGIVTWIFQDLMHHPGISFMIPIVLFVLLVALGSDYNIFLMSRVREEAETRPTKEGARLAAMVTGAVITACGIILAGTFASLTITPIRTLTQLGAAVAIGVFIDTFIVRALLVPAIASLLGRWNWWPSKHG